MELDVVENCEGTNLYGHCNLLHVQHHLLSLYISQKTDKIKLLSNNDKGTTVTIINHLMNSSKLSNKHSAQKMAYFSSTKIQVEILTV